jgi:hypothetical protein
MPFENVKIFDPDEDVFDLKHLITNDVHLFIMDNHIHKKLTSNVGQENIRKPFVLYGSGDNVGG